MGVAKTLPNYKSFTFDGTNSRNYGVYITGQGVFNAPERNVEMVEIPGRNGAYALDKGNFNNIEVTYPAGIFADTEADFAQAVSDLRNFLCSKSGYCQLEDDYNSGEYRMAIYKSGLEVSHEMLIAGEFNIVFECKPQRFLTSGEELITVGEWGETETAEGSIATFEVTDPNTKIKSLVAEINPIQDLNGYDSPWVGGGGKNKFSGEYFVGDVSTHYLDFFGGHSATGAFKDNGISVKANTTYAVSISFPTTPDGNWGVYGAYTESTTIITFSANASGATRTFTFTPTTDTKVVFWGYISDTWAQHNVSTIDGIKVQVEQGSATSWAPYSNICPISGTDEVGVVDDPTYGGFINWNQLIDVKSSSASKTENGVTFTDNRDGTYTISTGSGGATSVAYLSLGAFSVINGHKYVFISCPNGGGNNTYRAYLTGSVGSGGYDTGSGFLYTASATGTTYCVCAWIASGQVLTTPITFKPQLFDLTQMFGSGNEPTTVDEFKAIFPNDYYAYNAGTKTNASAVNGTPYISHTTTLPSTVYGGTLNVVSGVLTVTHAIETISSVSGSAEVNGFRLNNTLSGIKEAYGYCLCNMATRATAYREAVNVGGDTPNRIGYNDSGVILLNIQGITTIAELNTLLAQTPLVIVYELATPTTIQLTASQINTLKGTNNIFSTAGDVSVEYVADIQGYIDKKL